MDICRSSSFILLIMYCTIVQRNHSLIIRSPPLEQLEDAKGQHSWLLIKMAKTDLNQ